MKKLKQIKQYFEHELESTYGLAEAKQLFLIALHFIDGFSSKELILDAETKKEEEYLNCLSALKKNIPIQYHFSLAEFDGMELIVNPSVLIPRPETLELVLWIEKELRNKEVSICDIGTGSGCIALSLEKRLEDADIWACDKFSAALLVAKNNALKQQANVDFFLCDILQELPYSLDVLVSNPPYIPLSDREGMSALVLDNEPHTALFVEDEDPLIFYRRIIELAKKNHSLCFFEIHEELKGELEKMLHNFGLAFEFKRDMQDKYRMLKVQT